VVEVTSIRFCARPGYQVNGQPATWLLDLARKHPTGWTYGDDFLSQGFQLSRHVHNVQSPPENALDACLYVVAEKLNNLALVGPNSVREDFQLTRAPKIDAW
jgi:hypothetical protein